MIYQNNNDKLIGFGWCPHTSVGDSKDPGMGARDGREEGGKNPPVLEYTSRKDFFFYKIITMSISQSAQWQRDGEK